jgi:hypothetical protein
MADYFVELSDGVSLTYASTAVRAKNDAEAKMFAAVWANSLDEHFDDAWLVLHDNGRGITLRPGEF